MSRDLNVEQIKKLWILDLIIKNRSLKKAALEAKVSPSAISQTLTALEQHLGKPLIVRDRGTVAPTPDALSIIEIVRPAFEAFDRLRNLNETPAPSLAWLNFGTYESLSIDILPGLMQSLRTKMPHLRLGLRVSRTQNLMTMVRKGELCSALITEVDDVNRFRVQEVGSDRLGLYVSQRHPIAQLGWKAIETYGVGSLAPSKDGLPRYFRRFLKQIENTKPFLVCDSFESLRACTAAGTIVGVLPQRVAKRSNDLTEIFHPHKNLESSGEHKLLLISQTNCDMDEFRFLTSELRPLLKSWQE